MSKALSFLAGFGTGFIQQQERSKRQAKEDEERDLRMQEGKIRVDNLKQDANDKQAIRDAGAQRSAQTGTAVTGSTGTNFYKDPQEAAQAAEDAKAEAEMRGDVKPVTAAPATGISIQGAKVGNQITTQPVDVAKLNAPDERNKRILGTMWGIDPTKAMQMEAGLKQSKMTDMQITEAEAKAARESYNTKLMTEMRGNGVFNGAANILTQSESNGLAGVEFKALPSADGKMMQIHRFDQDGTSKVVKEFTNDRAGELRAVETMLQVPAEKMVDWHRDDVKQQRDLDQWTKKFEFEKKKHEDDQTYRKRVLGVQAAQEQRARELHQVAMQDAKIPPAVKMRAQSLAKEQDVVSGAIAKAQAENAFDPASENGKALIQRQARLGMQMDKLLNPYINADAKGNPKMAPGNGLPTAEEAGFGKPAPQAAPAMAPRASAAAPAAPVAAQGIPQPQRQPSAIDTVMAERLASFQPLADQARSARDKLVAVAKSGDQQAIQTYMQEAETSRKQLEAQVVQAFGNGAPAALAKLMGE